MEAEAEGNQERPGAALRLLRTLGWARVRWLLGLFWAAVVVVYALRSGVPTDRGPLAAIVISGLSISAIGHGWTAMRQVVTDWLPFTAVLLLYDRTRGIADRLGIPLHEADILRAEKWVFGGTEPTVWLQQQLYSVTEVHWYDALCTLVYTSHFLATPILAAVLWLRDRQVWLGFIRRVIVLSVAGLVTYVVFPEAPPWLAARDGLSPAVARLSSRGWDWFHAQGVHDLLAHAQADGANPVAAMPSLHTAFAVLVAIYVAGRIRSRRRALVHLYPVAMGFTLVYCGEHYVLDLVAGVVYALGAHAAVGWWERRAEFRRLAQARSRSADQHVRETAGVR
ncbi:MAG TPA: phosphatase PAP2 family protein [Jatrophihabitans sp.]|uniref:phosphatase PAP2 family protein n=1 Tax=Jatrophihabitans sp. TaxID=1932789 RepID=UPI002E08C216|nr:phosphatase PAP2 family protein [Jatrophihabitans sp.]